jgi:hypothetical protein
LFAFIFDIAAADHLFAITYAEWTGAYPLPKERGKPRGREEAPYTPARQCGPRQEAVRLTHKCPSPWGEARVRGAAKVMKPMKNFAR